MCHDSAMPLYYSLQGKRAVSNANAIAYEKAGENTGDEFKRKVRMARIVLRFIMPSVKILNVFKYRWFTYFYLGHRTSRYLLWFNHIVVVISNAFLVVYSPFYFVTMILQCIIYLMALMQMIFKTRNKILVFVNYYCMTIVAQFVGVVKTVLRRDRPFWEKAESTR